MAMDRMMEQTFDQPSSATEDEFTKSVERYTATIPSSAFLGLALGAMGLSLLTQAIGRGKWGNFVAQWVPTVLLLGIYNKLVKLEGHDRFDRGPEGRERQRVGISNRSLAEERASQQAVPSRGTAAGT